MSTMTNDNTIGISKKLSLESKHLLDELGMISTKAADLIPRLYESLKHDGLSPSEIRGFIESRISIGERRLRQLLPPEAKRDYIIRKKLPNIPPPPQVIHEIEPEPKSTTDKQTFTLDRHTCRGWPDDKLEKYEVVCQDGKVIRVIML